MKGCTPEHVDIQQARKAPDPLDVRLFEGTNALTAELEG
jgi:hypothetical protein